jgi:peptidyl-tRNA hydrolase
MFAGIGNPPGTMDLKAFLLQKFSSVERKQVNDLKKSYCIVLFHVLLRKVQIQ